MRTQTLLVQKNDVDFPFIDTPSEDTLHRKKVQEIVETVEYFSNKIFEPLIENSVLNLSNTHICNVALKVLEKGLNFCPTPGEPHLGDLKRDLENFHRRLRLRNFFDNTSIRNNRNQSNITNNISSLSDNTMMDANSDTIMEKEIKKSKVIKKDKIWDPPQGPVPLEAFILANDTDLNKTFVKAPHTHNISKNEEEALKKLAKNHNIVIKPADKGGAIVILDRDTYISEGNRQLSNTSFYRKTSTDLTEEHNEKVNTNIEFLRRNGEITKSLESKLVTNNVKTPELYLLPKIHENISPPPGRPVVSANKCPTEKISAFVDIFLRPHLPKTKSYLKDTTHLLQTLKELPLLKANAILCTLDVSSLYTNIPNNEGLKAVADFLSAHRVKGPNPEPTNSSLCKLLEMVLKMNNFNFDGNHYIQVSGTAMGTRVAPNFANIFMSDFEDKHIYSYHKQPLVWLKFIDDIFFIWEDGQESLDVFLKHLNQVHNSIKFTYETSRERVNFLDTWIQVNKEGKIDTDLYTKPTDSNNYLHYTSAHPTHNKKGIPYGQFLRLRRICSDEKSFVDHCIEKGRHFLRRGYPEDLIRTAFSKTLTKDRGSLLKPKRDTEEETKNILVSTYNPGFKGLSSIVHRNYWENPVQPDKYTKPLSQRPIGGQKTCENFWLEPGFLWPTERPIPTTPKLLAIPATQGTVGTAQNSTRMAESRAKHRVGIIHPDTMSPAKAQT